jgi:Spy/CpxP family protein refolding chaperone
MKTKLFAIIFLFLCIGIPSVASFASDSPNEPTALRKITPVSVSDAQNSSVTAQPNDPAVKANEQDDTPQDYESAMAAITQEFSVTLATIAEAVRQGKLTSKHGKEVSGEQYQLAQMQLQLLSLWREIEEADSTRIPPGDANPPPTQESEIVMVSLPFSSLQLNPSLADYLSLTPSQIKAIHQIMMQERQSLQPLMGQIRIAREKLLAISGDHMNAKEVKGLANAQAELVAKLIVSNARMQSRIYRILAPGQKKKLSDLERSQGLEVKKDR